MTIIYTHGTESANTEDEVKELRKLLPEWKIEVPSLPANPQQALEKLRQIQEETHPDIMVGIGWGGMLVQQIYGQHRIILNPTFRQKKHNQENETAGEDCHCILEHQFESIPEGEEKYIYGIFCNSREMTQCEALFKQHFKYNFGYKEECVTPQSTIKDILLPLIGQMSDEMNKVKKPLLYVDLDNVMVDFKEAITRLSPAELEKYKDHYDDIPHFFYTMKPMKGAIEAFKALSRRFDLYILSTAPWDNSTSWMDKERWVKEHLGFYAYKRLILSHHKNLNMGDYLIDDSPKNGAAEFSGKWLQFGKAPYENWEKVLEHFMQEGLL